MEDNSDQIQNAPVHVLGESCPICGAGLVDPPSDYAGISLIAQHPWPLKICSECGAGFIVDDGWVQSHTAP